MSISDSRTRYIRSFIVVVIVVESWWFYISQIYSLADRLLKTNTADPLGTMDLWLPGAI